jgi:hypothetical protein
MQIFQRLIIPESVTKWSIHIVQPYFEIGGEGSKTVGEPVPGAEVFISQEPGEDPIIIVEADDDGTSDGARSMSFTFTKKIESKN